MSARPDRASNARQAALALAAGYRCPDCDASTSLTEDAPGVLVLEVAHDATCPQYRRITGSAR
jgi:hypothetical protein